MLYELKDEDNTDGPAQEWVNPIDRGGLIHRKISCPFGYELAGREWLWSEKMIKRF